MNRSLVSFLTAVATVLALFTLTGFQVTSETAAERLLGRLGASMIEIDRWVPAHIEDIDLLARDRPEDRLEIGDLPMPVTLPASRLVAAEPQELTYLLRDEMGRVLYDQGTAAFRTSDGRAASLGVDEPVRWTVSLLESGRHGFWTLALLVSAVALAALVAVSLFDGRLPLFPIAVGAGAASLFSLAAWAVASALGGAFESAIDKEIMLIARDGAWMGLRNSVAIAVAAGLLLLMERYVTSGQRQSVRRSEHDLP